MVIFYTMAYNAAATLSRSIQSVLDQTEQDWIWYLLDNGSLDATGEIIGEYAKKDSRIKPLKNEKNLVFTADTSFIELVKKHDDADWFCFLDADDAYYPDFLKQMLEFAEKHSLDVAACGFDCVRAETGEIYGQRILTQDLILTAPEDFGTYFPLYHQFMRANWAKLFSIRITKRFDVSRCPDIYYGGDTLYTQENLRNTERFGILAKTLHRYYVSSESRSYQWDPSRFMADQILYQMAYSYLIDKCGIVSTQNRNFLQAVYSNAVTDTVGVICSSALTLTDKLREYRTIAVHPLTMAAYRECKDESVDRSKLYLLMRTLEAGAALGKQDNTDFRMIMQTLFPRCGQAVSTANVQMFMEDAGLLEALLQDDPEAILQNLLERMEKNQGVKKYSVFETVQALAVDKPLLCQIEDAVFLRKYAKIYWMVWQGDTLSPLEEMTGLLLENKVSGGRESFLQLYISLAATENQVSAFIFGKLKLAKLYFFQNRTEEFRAIMEDLEEMGVEGEDMDVLRQNLKMEDLEHFEIGQRDLRSESRKRGGA